MRDSQEENYELPLQRPFLSLKHLKSLIHIIHNCLYFPRSAFQNCFQMGYLEQVKWVALLGFNHICIFAEFHK